MSGKRENALATLICATLCTSCAGPKEVSTPRPASDALEQQVSRAAELVFAAARAKHSSIPFESASLARGGDERVWRITISAELPSPFEFGEDACRAQASSEMTVCHTLKDEVICSRSALAALAAFDSRASVDRPAVTLLHVLSHELGHIAEGHGAGMSVRLETVPEEREKRMAALRRSVERGGAQIALEKAADGFAASVLEPILTRPPYLMAGEDPWIVAQYHRATIAVAMGTLDEKTRCLWTEEVSLPADDEHVTYVARKLVCEVLNAKTGRFLPVLRGTHPDWGTRMSVLREQLPNPPRPAQADSNGLGAFQQLVDQVNIVFAFMEAEYEQYYLALAPAVRRQSLEWTSEDCQKLQPPLTCAPLVASRPETSDGRLSWTTSHEGGTLSIPGDVVALVPDRGRFAVALQSPNRVGVWNPAGATLRVAPVPCEPQWASLDGEELLVACKRPGGVMRIAGDRYTLMRIDSAKRADDPGMAPVRVRWVGRLHGRLLLSAGYETGPGGFTADWTDGSLRELAVAQTDDCTILTQMAPLRLETDPRGSGILATPFHDPAQIYVLDQQGAHMREELDAVDWQVWAAENGSDLGVPYECRASYHGEPGVRCIFDTWTWVEPTRKPDGVHDGKLSLPRELAARSPRVAFCDTRSARWAFAFHDGGGLGVLVKQGKVADSIELTGASDFLVGCGPDGAALAAQRSGESVLIPLP